MSAKKKPFPGEATDDIWDLIDRMASMLRRLEYGADDGLCCLCHGYPERGHAPTCDLSILLKELP